MKINLDDAIEKVSDLAQSGLAKSAQVTEMAKLQVNNATEQENIKKMYSELGKYYYTHFSSCPEPSLEGICEKIRISQINIVTNNQRIKELRHPDIIFSPDKVPNDVVDVDIVVEETPVD